MQAISDAHNPTYQADLHKLFEPDGRLKPFQRAKYEPKLRLLREAGLSPSDALLDVGVGYGAWLSFLERSGQQRLFGMDPFVDSIALAQQRTSAQLAQGRIEDAAWPFSEGFFSAVTCFEVVEHLPAPALFFERAERYLKPGGYLLVTTPLLELGYRLRRLPLLGKPDTNPTHINVQPPSYWLDLICNTRLQVVKTWRGESLTHIKYVHHLGSIAKLFGMDHRQIPGLRQFEQSFCLLARLRGPREQGAP